MKRVAVRNLRLCTKDCLCLYVCPTGATVGAGAALFAAASGAKADFAAPQRGHVHVSGSAAKGLPCFASS